MKRVTGIGGVFYRVKEKEKLLDWYRRHLGIEAETWGFMFRWDGEPKGYTVWSLFSDDTEYFAPSERPFMINFRVADLEALLPVLREEGVEVVGGIDVEENGKFAWILDPEGTKLELWEPADPSQDPYV
jgi:predicted enzyme related to lactoylglutathione lyase